MGNIGSTFFKNVVEIIPGMTSSANTDGNLGHFTVTTAQPSDITKAAALQYHDFDINGSHNLFKFTVRRKGIKSKFARRNDDDEEDGDSDVDETTREESAPNDPRHQRNPNVVIAKLAKGNDHRMNREEAFGR